MGDLSWSWLAVPYVVCAVAIVAVALGAALVRGDRVLRLGVIGGAVSALPWALCQGLAALTHDPAVALRMLKLGQGPVALVGPNILLVLLGVSGQLERHRWTARIAHVIGLVFLVVAWSTNWVAGSVQVVPAGMFYLEPGPLTGLYSSQLLLWLVVGIVIARGSMPPSERGKNVRLLLVLIACGAIGSTDALLLYRIWGVYPMAWLPATISAGIALYLVTRTNLLRPQGFDRSVAIETAGFAVTIVAIAVVIYVARDATAIAVAAAASAIWTIVMAVTGAISRVRPVRVAGERALEQFVGRVAGLDDEAKVAERLAVLWRYAVGIVVRKTWTVDGDDLLALGGSGERWTLDREVLTWLVAHGDSIGMTELATMRLGGRRAKLEALGKAHGATLIVPLIDRGELVGLVEANYGFALRDAERGLVAESALAAARALTFVGLARAAERERETAREVEVADALRQQASASRDAELGRWAVAAEYQAAPRTTGAGWSAIELADGRLALLATEAQAHGVAAALATAALTGAFAAATAPGAASATVAARVALDELLVAMRASAEGVMRGGEPVATFIAILDAAAQTIEWACAGHPGAFVVGPIAIAAAATARGAAQLPANAIVVIASSALRGDDDQQWQDKLRGAAPASGRLATVLVETSLRAAAPSEDLLAVVVRAR